MKDNYYADDRDLLKWGVLLKLAESYKRDLIIQIAFYRKSYFPKVHLDGKKYDIPEEVIDHFRSITNIKKLKSQVNIEIFGQEFTDRDTYINEVCSFIGKFKDKQYIILIDPDTGLEPAGKTNHTHVLKSEIRRIWGKISNGSVLVFYQHQTNRRGEPWIDKKRKELAEAINVKVDRIKIAAGKKLASDVVLYYIHKKP